MPVQQALRLQQECKIQGCLVKFVKPPTLAEVASAHIALEQQQVLVCLVLPQLGHKLGRLPGSMHSVLH